MDGCLLLVSLLLGAGYRAFCVYGKADYSYLVAHHPPVEFRELTSVTSSAINSLPAAPLLESKFETAISSTKDSTCITIDNSEPSMSDIRDYLWVWLSSGKRGVSSDMFLDVLTGQVYQPSDSTFVSIDSIWTDTNMWIHIHPHSKIAVSTLDLTDQRRYEPVLSDVHSREAELPGLSTLSFSSLPKSLRLAHPKLVEEHRFSPASIHQRYVSTVNARFSYEYFSPYSQKDGLVAKLVTYNDPFLEDLCTVTEIFEHRCDKLIRRKSNIKSGSIEEYFCQGRYDAIKQVLDLPCTSRRIYFYGNRGDSLKDLEETGRLSFCATYAGRPDRLISLRADFSASSRLPLRLCQTFSGSGTTIDGSDEDFAVSITDFAREITFDYHENKVILEQHGREGGIRPRRIGFTRENGLLALDRSVCGSNFTITDTRLVGMQDLEKSAQKALDDCLEVFDRIERIRRNEEQLLLPTLDVKIADQAAYRSNAALGASEAIGDAVGDELQFRGAHPLRLYFLEYQHDILEKREAEEVATKAKSDMKKRLLERAALIKTRILDERDQLNKRAAVNSARLQEGLSPDPHFAEYSEQALLRIAVLEQSLAKFEAQAFTKFEELERLLAEHPRLSNLWS